MNITDLSLEAAAKMKQGRPYDFNLAKTEACFLGWAQSMAPVLNEYDVVEVEQEFKFALVNPDTKGESRTFTEAGKMDGILCHKRTKEFKLLEHKTTGDSLEPESDYWAKLGMDSQVSKYILACRNLGLEVYGALYDVIRKPGQRPSNIPLLDENKVKIVHDASGNRVRTKDGKKWRESASSADGYELQTRPETPDEFFARIRFEIESDPAKYFVKKDIPRLDSQLIEFMEDEWALSQEILHRRKKNLWPRNPAACTAFGTCEFFALCSGRGSVDGIQYRQKAKANAELVMENDGDKELLTNSRLTALRKCSRYHFHRYEQPIESVQEDPDALVIGTAFHQAAEHFLRAFINK